MNTSDIITEQARSIELLCIQAECSEYITYLKGGGPLLFQEAPPPETVTKVKVRHRKNVYPILSVAYDATGVASYPFILSRSIITTTAAPPSGAACVVPVNGYRMISSEASSDAVEQMITSLSSTASLSFVVDVAATMLQDSNTTERTPTAADKSVLIFDIPHFYLIDPNVIKSILPNDKN